MPIHKKINDYYGLKETQESNDSCGGFRHCKNRVYDKHQHSCLECFKEALDAVTELDNRRQT